MTSAVVLVAIGALIALFASLATGAGEAGAVAAAAVATTADSAEVAGELAATAPTWLESLATALGAALRTVAGWLVAAFTRVCAWAEVNKIAAFLVGIFVGKFLDAFAEEACKGMEFCA